MKPPKKPHWRWLTYHALLGRDKDGVGEEVLRFAKQLAKKHDDRIKSFREIDAIDLLKHEKKEPDPSITRGLELRDEPPIRQTLQEMLLERCDLELIQDALYHKFKETIPVDALAFYRDYFWDTEYLNAYEFGQYFAESDEKRPDPPPIRGKWRPHYRIFQEGGDVDISMDEAMEHMFQRAFFRSEELARLKSVGDEKVLKFQKNAAKIYKSLRKAERQSGGSIELPEEFDKKIEYPDTTAVDADRLDGYDPHDDPNEEQDDE